MKHTRMLATIVMTIVGALPAIAQSDDTAKLAHVLPHIVDGDGWQSTLLVTNVADLASRCTFISHGLPVARFRNRSDVTAAVSTATFELGGPGGYLVWSTGNESPLASGYATMDCTAAERGARTAFTRAGLTELEFFPIVRCIGCHREDCAYQAEYEKDG